MADRAQVMAYRIRALGLADREPVAPAELPVLDLGVQPYTPGSERVALAARTTAALDDDRLLTVWAARGAPHLHRRADVGSLLGALWPLSDADATARITSGQIPDGMRLGVEAFRATAAALRSVVDREMPRGEASTAVSRVVPVELTYDCKACGARHIAGNVWQHAGLAGGVQVTARGRGSALAPIEGIGPIPADNSGIESLIVTYLRFLGPAGPAEVAKYLGTTTAVIKSVWPSDLERVTVDGRTAWLPPEAVSDMSPVSGVRLLPPYDPLLQARDRDLLVPDRAAQKEIWRVLGNPGALLVDGEIAGTWRGKVNGRKSIAIEISPFGTLTARHRKAVEAESAHVARARNVPAAEVSYP